MCVFLKNASIQNVVQRCSGSINAIMRLLFRAAGCALITEFSRKTNSNNETSSGIGETLPYNEYGRFFIVSLGY
jgi:hypothetical protein